MQKPPVVNWYWGYVAFLAFLFLLVIGLGSLPLFDILTEEDLDGMPKTLFVGIYMGAGILLLIPTLTAYFLPRRRWAWIYHLVLICIGMTGCTVVFSIPLLIFWIRPEVKAYFDPDRSGM